MQFDHNLLYCGSFFFFNLFLAVLGLCLHARAFSSCGKQGHSSSWCVGLSLSRPLLLRSTGSRPAGSVVVAHGPSCSTACGIFPDQGSNPCPCIGRQILNHCATREAQPWFFFDSSCLVLQEALWVLRFCFPQGSAIPLHSWFVLSSPPLPLVLFQAVGLLEIVFSVRYLFAHNFNLSVCLLCVLGDLLTLPSHPPLVF